MEKRDFLKLTLQNDISYLPVAQFCVKETAKKLGFAEEELCKIELALEEAVINVIEHAFEADEQGTFDIICESIPKGIKITIREKGMPFDPDSLPTYRPGKDIDDISPTGLGVYLMKKNMDQILFRNLGCEGKETHLIKYLPRKYIKEYMSASELQLHHEAHQEPQPLTDKVAYDIRILDPREAIEVSKSAYKSHGYTFFDDHIYYPDQIIEMNNSGQMISAVAVTKDNVFMGHAALVYPILGSRIAEMTFFFVNPEYRNQGCMNRMAEFLFAVDKKFPLDGVYGYAVTNHLYTQKTSSRYGFKDCGIELATSPATWIFKGINGDSSQRMSVVLSFRYLKEPKLLTLYPPANHRAIVEKLYRSLGVQHNLVVPQDFEAQLRGNESVIDTRGYISEGNAEIFLSQYGANVVREVKHILRDLCVKQVAAINLFLNLEDPLTYFMTPKFEEMGFFFSGILPRTDIGDTLILQYLNNVGFDYEKVMTYSDMAKETLAYIRKCDPNIAL